ncbi:MAG: phospho-N-acetylmuramoyl-pentapeptide-transferase [Candidatus Parcubacteria bacterium]|nr:MAG: phospho-N-acetylmuramoyl-pentapeptide-transferase [Candidatus Parcubacteria bacterium]GIW67128.1 MAG: phospho-N-acetylmuramoyl-pentapeptide-transferase [Candidatus Parcubacteria bacterium]GIW67307.1 MAG: phospho-N-acetylmuramoyl-pentapeptide-transferase [Candidatus Parcubacteria bacterium]
MVNEVFLNLIKIVSLGILSFLLSLFLVPFYLKIALRFNLTDKPHRQDAPIATETLKEKAGTPTMAGVIIWLPPLILALLILLLKNIFGNVFDFLNFVSRRETYLSLAGLFLGGIFGLIDDLLRQFNLTGLRRRDTFLIYLTIGLFFAWWFIAKLNFSFIDLPQQRIYLGVLLFLLYFLFVFLAVVLSGDITDGVDGLFGGLSFSIILTLTIFAFLNQDYNLASFGATLLGSLLAYLWFNFYPAKFFDGNTGSFSVGIAIVLMSFFTQSSLLLPLLAPIFVLEAGSVILQIFSKKILKRKIFLSTPIHHHLRAIGWHEANITFRFWIINIIGCLLAGIIYLLLKFI